MFYCCNAHVAFDVKHEKRRACARFAATASRGRRWCPAGPPSLTPSLSSLNTTTDKEPG